MKTKSQKDNLVQDIKLPELGEGVTEGELVKWLVSKGDKLNIDQPVAEVMTDKASMEVPSPFDGVVESFLVKEGKSIQVGQSILTLKASFPAGKTKSDKEEQSGDFSSSEPVLKSVDPLRPSDVNLSAKSAVPEEPENESFLATPFTRRLARQLHVSLSGIQGSGLAGRITKEDVLKYSKNSTGFEQKAFTQEDSSATGFSIPVKDQQERTPLKGVRKKIAEKMQASKKIIPHFTLLQSAEVEGLDRLKNSVKDMLKAKNIKVTYLSFVMKCLLQTLKEFPELNAGIDDLAGEVVIKKYYNFGFAVDTPRGLLVPVIKDVDQKSLAELSFEIQTLAEKARAGNILPEDMSGGTITVTNIGSLGGEYATPIINAPEVAILGMYRLYIKPCWDGSSFVPKKTMNFSLTCDHRLIDGAVSARALKFFVQKLEKPLSLFI